MGIDWKDVLVRSAKTFAETAVAFVVAHLSGVELFSADGGVWASLAISAGAAGVAAVYNGVIRPMLRLPGEKEK